MAVDPNQPVFDIVTVDEVLSGTVIKQRMSAWIVGAFGVTAFCIGLIGVGGVLSYAVAIDCCFGSRRWTRRSTEVLPPP
jgi:hypothetical protein